MTCKHCNRETHPHYLKKYDGFCLDCFNAGVPDLLEENSRLIAACKAAVELIDEPWAMKEMQRDATPIVAKMLRDAIALAAVDGQGRG